MATTPFKRDPLLDALARSVPTWRLVGAILMRMMLSFLLAATLATVSPAATKPRTTIELAGAQAKPDPDRAIIDEATASIRQGRYADAIATLDPVIARYTRAWEHSDKLIFSARSTEEMLMYSMLAGTGKIHRDTVVVGPEWIDALQLKSYALMELKRVDEALPVIEKAVALAPMNSRLFSELGYAQGQAGQLKKALASYDSALDFAGFATDDEKNAERIRAHHGRGFVLTEMGRLDDAEAAYRKALAIDPADSVAKHELQFIANKRNP